MSRIFLKAWGVSLSVLGACASAGVPSPRVPLDGYTQAVAAGDARAAYATFSPDVRARLPFERFQALFEENRAELTTQAEAIQIAIRDGVPARAYARTHTGDEVGLVFEDGAWRIDSGVFQEASARTPLDAVLALRRALGRRDFETALSLLTAQRRDALEAGIRDWLELTDDPNALEVLVQGDRATLRTASGREIRLVREDGDWHVADVE